MKTYDIVTVNDAALLEAKLTGSVVESVGIAQNDTSIEIYFTNGSCVSIEGAKVESLGINAELEIELREED